jgi:hypothetical protein
VSKENEKRKVSKSNNGEKMIEEFENRQHLKDKKKYYGDLSKNALEFFQVVEILSPYLTTFNLSQINHDMSTQVNEALNKSMTSLASKDRVYNGSCSLAGRQSIVVMRRNEGHGKYLDDICRKIDIQRHGGIQWLSHQKEKTVSKKRLRSMESSSKCQRSSKKRRAR